MALVKQFLGLGFVTVLAILASLYYLNQSNFVIKLDAIKRFIPNNSIFDFFINTSSSSGEEVEEKFDFFTRSLITKSAPSDSYSLASCQSTIADGLNVHFVLHSHDDPGWLKTPEEYYKEDVRTILFAVMEQLGKNINRRFVYSEMYFFKKWWDELDEHARRIVKKFVADGQLEFVGGGWVQNDDALTHYSLAIDQTSYGLNIIKTIFGLKAKPKFGWQIDSFGYSKEQAALFAQAGFEAEVIQRLPYYDIESRRNNGDMEFMWLGDSRHKIFTHILYESYVAPEGFRYETGDNEQITESKFGKMISIAKQRRKSYKTDHLMMLMGHDFVYKNASIWFNAVDKIIELENQNFPSNSTKVHFLYSTPSCYLKAVREQLDEESLTEKNDDFFPYCNNQVSMWTGYFSSRPTLKGLIQKIGSMLQTVENLEWVISTVDTVKMLNDMRENIFTTLHHDAITGTCKQAVANDYIRSLLYAESIGQKLLSLIHSNLSRTPKEKSSKKTFFCPLLNISVCPFSQSRRQFSVTIFNGRSTVRQEYVSIPVNSSNFELFDGQDEKIASQIIKIDNSDQLRNPNMAKFALVFPVALDPLGFSTYVVKRLNSKNRKFDRTTKTKEKNFIENEFFRVSFNGSTGLMIGITNLKTDKFLPITQHYLWYDNHRSGAYIFRPGDVHNVLADGSKVELKRREGPLLQEMEQNFTNWASQIVRLYKGKSYVEVQWTVGPLMEKIAIVKFHTFHMPTFKPLKSYKKMKFPNTVGHRNLKMTKFTAGFFSSGKEVITRFSTDISNGDLFYTDANGRQLVKRRSTPIFSPEYPTASVYFPITAAITINDTNNHLALITDRPMGGSSLFNGSVEILLHRKVMGDDGAGMGEGLYETGEDGRHIVVRGKFRVAISDSIDSNVDDQWRDLAKDMFYEPILMFSYYADDERLNLPKFSALRSLLPDGVHLLSLQKVDHQNVLLRLENYLNDLNNRTVSLQPILPVKNCTEMVLTGDATKSSQPETVNANDIVLKPMEIKTFLCRTFL